MHLQQEELDQLAKQLFLPLVLLMDYAMFQYLVTIYYKRRSEFRVRQLFLCSFLGFATLISFARDNETTTQNLNDVSETCALLTFLIQITIIGWAVQKKVKVKSIVILTYVAEVFIYIGWINITLNFIELGGVKFSDEFHLYNNIYEDVVMIFICFFRFYYLSISKGFFAMVHERKREMIAYFLMVTHEYPWMVLDKATGLSWEYEQALYHRLTIVSCILINVMAKTGITSNRTKSRRGSANTEEQQFQMMRTKRQSTSRKELQYGKVVAVESWKPPLPAPTVSLVENTQSLADAIVETDI